MTALKLFLFDLDGTLVSTGGAGLRALSLAFKELYGVESAHQKISPAGKTDPAIFRELVQIFFARPVENSETLKIAECYLHHLSSEMKNSSTKALPGVMDFVSHVSERPDILSGLGTGNLEKGARLKLEPVQLNRFFSFGGFGSDAEDRARVLRYGHERAEQKLKRTISPEAVYVIGDTLLDVAAAQRAGFRSVAVASGSVKAEQLRTGRPDHLLNDLTEGFQLLEAIDRELLEAGA